MKRTRLLSRVEGQSTPLRPLYNEAVRSHWIHTVHTLVFFMSRMYMSPRMNSPRWMPSRS